MPRIRPARRPAGHASSTRVRSPREPTLRQPGREPAANGAGHGEDAGPQAESAPPREDRAG